MISSEKKENCQNDLNLSVFSLSHVQKYLESNKISDAFEIYSNLLKTTQDQSKKVFLYINKSFASLQLQMTKMAISCANKAIKIDKYTSVAYFIGGIAHLWNKDEGKALLYWTNGVKYCQELSFFVLMTALNNSPNFRANLYNEKFDVNHIFKLIDSFASPRFNVDSDIQDAYAELRNNSVETAIDHFSMILSVNPQDYYAYKGRGVAYCMIGEYNKCIDDLTIAIQMSPNSFQTDTVKVRAIALAALGNITRAIIDLNKYLLIMPEDYEVVIEIARLHMKRKAYQHAHKMFLTVPESAFDDKGYISFAECLYAVGELSNANKIIDRVVSFKNHLYYYVRYLIKRDLNEIGEAKKDIVEAVKITPSFFLLRVAADFFYDIGDNKMAIDYYEEALQQCSNDAETQIFLAYSLFENGNFIESAELIYEVIKDSTCFDFKGSLEHFNEMNLGINLFQCTQDNYNNIIRSIQNPDICITELTKIHFFDEEPEISQNSDNNSQEILHKFDLNPQILKMISDADRFGKRCFSQAYEKNSNPRLIRALGFCVLRLAYMIKYKWLENPPLSFIIAFDDIISILSFVDMKQPLMYSYTSTTNLPSYYIIKKGKISPRFYNFISDIFFSIKSQLSNQKIDDFNDIFHATQRDFFNEKVWQIEKGNNLKLPSYFLKYNGVYGFDLVVRPPFGKDQWKKYKDVMQKAFNDVLNNTKQSFDNLILFIFLIWMIQPLSRFSPECGYIFLNAYSLAISSSEIDHVDESNGEIFLKCMLDQNFQKFSTTINEHIHKNTLKSQYDEESLQYWASMPSISTLIQLLNVEAT